MYTVFEWLNSSFYMFLCIGCNFYVWLYVFLNQAHAWFLKIDPVQIFGMHVHVCVCVRPLSYK